MVQSRGQRGSRDKASHAMVHPTGEHKKKYLARIMAGLHSLLTVHRESGGGVCLKISEEQSGETGDVQRLE